MARPPVRPTGPHQPPENGSLLKPAPTDVLCNAGGVIVSYFEWLQNKRSEFWDIEEVDCKLRKKIANAYGCVREKVATLNTDWRTAAYVLALTRLETVYKERGIFP